ncbi:hypothetical protein, partial [Cupriavidus basilensis]|uniref:hypothetical protein n=2 Tax=Cupriavidus TaxID=106589 RepID=UPI0023E869E9
MRFDKPGCVERGSSASADAIRTTRRLELSYNRAMFRADRPSFFRGVLLLLLFAMQLLTPLLHGHLGTPKLHGLHVHTALQGAVNSYSPSASPSVSAAHDGSALVAVEPLEVDVQTAIGPIAFTLHVQAADVLVGLVFAFLLFAALPLPAPRRLPWRERTPPRWRGGD